MQRLLIALVLAVITASSIAQESGQIESGGYEEAPAATSPTGHDTGAVVNPTCVNVPAVVVPAGLTPEEHQHLAITAHNLEVLASRPKAHQRNVEVHRQINITNRFLMERKVIQKTLTPSQLVQMLKDLGMLRSGASTWGRNDVRFCLDEGILVGRNPGTTTASSEWRTYCTREELATALARMDKRVDGKIATAIAGHNSDPASHPDIRKRIDWADYKVNWTLWVLLILALLLILVRFLQWLWCRLHPGPAPAPPFVTPPLIPAVGGGGPGGAGPIVPFRNNTGLEH